MLSSTDDVDSTSQTAGIRRGYVQWYPQDKHSRLRKKAPTVSGNLTVQPGIGNSVLLAVTIYDIDLDEDIIYISWGYTRRSKGLDDPLFTPYSCEHNTRYAPPQLWEEIGKLPYPLVEPFQAIYGDPEISKDEVLHQPLVNLLIQRKDLSNILKKHKVVFIGDSAHTWSNHAGTGGNTAIIDGLDLRKVLQEGKKPEDFCNKCYQRWKDSFDSNAKAFGRYD
jgi:hypothetical protein